MSEIKKKKQNPKLPFPVHSHLTYEFEHYFELAFNTRTPIPIHKKKNEKGKSAAASRRHVDASLDLFARKSPRSWRDLAEVRALSARRPFLVGGGI
jgi:hypothetical protein